MTLIEKALQIALEAHAGQTDKAGAPYLLHPIRVMLKMESEMLQAAALLHDVLEDSAFTADDLRARGIPEEVLELVTAVTKREDEESDGESGYERFIERIAGNRRAARIKLADIEDNLDVRRIAELTEKDLRRIAKYHLAWRRLKAVLDAPGEIREGGRRSKERALTGDESILKRGYIVVTPANSVMPRKPRRAE